MRRHTKTHSGQSTSQEGQIVSCDKDDCDVKVRRINLLKHDRNHERYRLTCTDEGCDQKLKSLIDLKRHIAVTHRGGAK